MAGCIGVLNCGGSYFVGFVSNPGGETSVTGQVSGVTSGFTSDPSGVTPVTVVTFVNTGAFFTLYFCCDQHSLFPLNVTVRADYTKGILCSLLVRVVIINEAGTSAADSSSRRTT